MSKTTPTAIKKILPLMFAVASAGMTSCDALTEQLPEELSEAANKEFWLSATQTTLGDDSINFKERLAEQMEKGELVILDKGAEWSRVYQVYNASMDAAIITPDHKDTLVLLRYNMDFIVYNPSHQQETGEINREKQTVEIRLKDDSEYGALPSSIEIENQKSYDRHGDLANSSLIYSFK